MGKTCSYAWCVDEVPFTATDGTVGYGHQSVETRIHAADDVVSVRVAYYPDLSEVEGVDVLLELSSTVLVWPARYEDVHVLLTGEEVDDLISALNSARQHVPAHGAARKTAPQPYSHPPQPPN